LRDGRRRCRWLRRRKGKIEKPKVAIAVGGKAASITCR
jgi:hypothetical protein